MTVRTGVFLALIVLQQSLKFLDSLIHLLYDAFKTILIVRLLDSFANGLVFEEGKVL